MDKKSNSYYCNIYYIDDNNKKHLAYNLSPKELNFIYTRYGKDKVQLTTMSHQFNSRTPVFQTGDVGGSTDMGLLSKRKNKK